MGVVEVGLVVEFLEDEGGKLRMTGKNWKWQREKGAVKI